MIDHEGRPSRCISRCASSEVGLRRFLKPMDDRRPRGCLHDLGTKARKFLKTGAHPYQPARSRRPRPAVGPRCAGGCVSMVSSQRSHSGLSQRPVPGTLNVKVSLSRPSTRSIPRSKGSCSHEDSQTRPCNVTKTLALLNGPIRGNLSVNPRLFGDVGVIGREFYHAPAFDTAHRAITRAALSL